MGISLLIHRFSFGYLFFLIYLFLLAELFSFSFFIQPVAQCS